MITFRLPESIIGMLTELSGGQNYKRTQALCRSVQEQHAREIKKKAAMKH